MGWVQPLPDRRGAEYAMIMLDARGKSGTKLSFVVLFVLGLGTVLDPGPARASTPCKGCDPLASFALWTWAENCHVERAHKLTDFGTAGSLLVTGDIQMILTQPAGGDSRTGYSYLATLRQGLWSGGELISYAVGGTSDTLDPIIGDVAGTNGLALPCDLFVSRLFILQNLFKEDLQLVAGKVDLSDFFDTNAVANCEETEFLAGSLVNNPTIAFPQAGIAGAARYSLTADISVQGAVADASAVATTPGLETAFHGGDHLFSILEMDVSPFSARHSGVYRFIFWHDSTPAAAGEPSERGNRGFALSFDQAATDELDLFFRYGADDEPVGGLTGFWSCGACLDGPWRKRPQDCLQMALAVSEAARHDEILVEIGYRAVVSRDLALTPLVQIIGNPAASPDPDTFVVPGLRAVYVF
jgi:hypothetical protein